jgi:hypothetical protein
MRVPHEQYIRFLITTGLDAEESNEHLSELGLPPVSASYWDQQHEILHGTKLPNTVKSFWNLEEKKKFPKDFFSYMNSLGLKEAWAYNVGKDKYFMVAVDVLKDPDVSICTRALLSMKTAVEEVSALVNGKFGMAFPKESVELFQKYFFQPLIMTRESWRKYIDTIPREERSLIYQGITGDKNGLRAELSLPVKISVADHYQKLHIFAMQKFDTYRNSNDPSADQHALKWAQMAMSSGDKYEKLKIGDATDFGRDIQMEFDFIDTDFPMIGEETLEEIRDHAENGMNNDEASPIPMGEKENSHLAWWH